MSSGDVVKKGVGSLSRSWLFNIEKRVSPKTPDPIDRTMPGNLSRRSFVHASLFGGLAAMSKRAYTAEPVPRPGMKIREVKAFQPATPGSPPDWRTQLGQIAVQVETESGLVG